MPLFGCSFDAVEALNLALFELMGALNRIQTRGFEDYSGCRFKLSCLEQLPDLRTSCTTVGIAYRIMKWCLSPEKHILSRLVAATSEFWYP